MRKKKVIQVGECYHLVSRMAHRAYFFDYAAVQVVPEPAGGTGVHRADPARDAHFAAPALLAFTQGKGGLGLNTRMAYTVKHIRKALYANADTDGRAAPERRTAGYAF